MARNKKGPTIKKGLDDWMATYADMVTLLFCFFVMLYSAASVDETKFQYILQAFRSDGMFINTIVGRPQDDTESSEVDGNSDVPFDQPGDAVGNPPGVTASPYLFDALYTALEEAIEEHDLQDMLDISSTPGRIRIQLSSDIAFDGDSYALKPEAQAVLRIIAPAITQQENVIGDIQVQGHTAATASLTGIGDWRLSSLRAVSVVDFLDLELNMVASEKFKSEGFGPYNPVASNDTATGRSRNRRVEIIINRCMNITQEEDRRATDTMIHDYGHPLFGVDAEGQEIRQPGTPVPSVVAGILSDFEARYGDPDIPPRPQPVIITPPAPIGPSIPSVGGQSGFIDIRESDFMPVEDVEPEPGDSDENGEE